MKRLISVILLIIMVTSACFSLFGCAFNREYDPEEVADAARELIKKSEVLNSIYYGEGLPYLNDPSYAEGLYFVADYYEMTKLGISNLDDLKDMTRSVFSKVLAESMINASTSSVYEGEELILFSRYYQKYDPLTNEPVDIMVYSKFNPFLTDEVVYDYESVIATHSERDVVYVTINAVATNEDGESQTNVLKIGLIEEEDGWRLSTPTYTSYIDREEYEKLENK